MMQRILIALLACVVLAAAAGCTGKQRSAALASVGSLRASTMAYAAMPPTAEEPAATPPGGPPPGTPPAPPSGGAPGKDAPPAAGKPGEAPKAKTPEQIIEDFVASDPRDILDEKTKDLKGRQTEPWNEEKPEAFIPETGRKDPMRPVESAIPDELLPKRTGNDDESELQNFLYTYLATQVLDSVAKSLQCHSVIQIGIQKWAQMSFAGGGGGGGRRGGGGGRFVISEGQGFSQNINGMSLSVQVVSISTDEVVVNVSVTPQGTNVTVEKNLVYIPRY
jgi:hypothetical protein